MNYLYYHPPAQTVVTDTVSKPAGQQASAQGSRVPAVINKWLGKGSGADFSPAGVACREEKVWYEEKGRA